MRPRGGHARGAGGDVVDEEGKIVAVGVDHAPGELDAVGAGPAHLERLAEVEAASAKARDLLAVDGEGEVGRTGTRAGL